jgi:hypothetical protein
MKTLKIIIAVTILSLFSISCSKDDESAPEQEPTKPTYLLTKSTNDLGYSNYTYDANNKLSTVEHINPGFTNYKTTFFYNSNGKLEETLEVSTGGAFPSSTKSKVTYIYDAQNRLIEKKHFQTSYDFPTQYDYVRSYFFEYNGNSVIQKVVDKGNSLPSNRYVFDFDTNGNILKYTSYNQIDANNPNGLINFSTVYVFDDKVNVESSFPTESLFPFLTKNNPIKYTQTDQSGTPTITDIAYEYNQDGYPIKRTVSGQAYTFEWKKI